MLAAPTCTLAQSLLAVKVGESQINSRIFFLHTSQLAQYLHHFQVNFVENPGPKLEQQCSVPTHSFVHAITSCLTQTAQTATLPHLTNPYCVTALMQALF